MKTFVTIGLFVLIVLVIIAVPHMEKKGPLHADIRPPVTKQHGGLPAMKPFDDTLLKKIENMRKLKGEQYKPRTKHLLDDKTAKYTNRLFLETSPYLIQHAHNPVNWYPWGDEAFETAKKLNLPVLVSIGYSTCHWCHVMEEESFEDEEIARYLNEHFIAVKVDREERPDVDSIYMTAVQAMTGGGGWPLNVFLFPNRKPFYGGTYFPARDGDRGPSTGFLTILQKINDAYHNKHETLEDSSNRLTEVIQKALAPEAGTWMPDADIIHKAIEFYKSRFDIDHGGLTGAPKFPSSLPIQLLLRYHRRTNDQKALDMAARTLEKMAGGGIYDHAGGGFHRYATDSKWLVPHFEKMLYDNALLAVAYIEGFQATGNKDFKRVAKEILDYVQKDMTSPHGAFYSATDADSLAPSGHREEGWFFTWTGDEIIDALGEDRAKIVKKYYSVGLVPDFEGRHILNTPEPADDIAKSLNISEQELKKVIDESKKLLVDVREKRPSPLRDEKILTAWNGLMISAYARAGLILGDVKYITVAEKTAEFILENLFVKDRLLRSYNDGQARHNGYLDDYAFFMAALMDLYEADHNPLWLQKAIELDKIMEGLYEDTESGGFFMTGKGHENLIAREKPNQDGAIPSGNSIAVMNLLRMGEFTTKANYYNRAQKALKTFLGSSSSNPIALSEMLLALDFFIDKPKEIIIVTPNGKEDEAGPFLKELRNQFLPNRILAVTTEEKSKEQLAKIAPVVKGKIAIGGKTTAYICENGVCKLPVHDPKDFLVQISKKEGY